MGQLRNPEATRTFAHNLRRVRLLRRLSQEDVDFLYGARPKSISKFERSTIEPRLLTVIGYAGCLEASIDDLALAAGPAAPPDRVAHRRDLPPVGRDEIAASISTRLRDLRIERGIGREDFARLATMNPRNLAHLEDAGAQRTSLPGVGILVGIAAALGVRPSDLTAGVRYVPLQGLKASGQRRARGYMVQVP